MANTLNFEITQRPDFALVTVHLEQGQKVFAEPSSMATMDPSIRLTAGLKGGLMKSIGRALGGESMIVNTLAAESGPGEVSFAAGAPGDTQHYRLQGNSLMLQRGAFLMHSEGVELTSQWGGAKGFFSGQGLVLLRASGVGDIFFNSYGALLELNIAGQFYIDTGYVLAFEDTLQYEVTVVPGLNTRSRVKTLFFGGEGLVCHFNGQGKVWLQTRYVNPFLNWVHMFRPSKNN